MAVCLSVVVLTGPGCNLKPANCTEDKGNSSLPPMGGLSMTLRNVLFSCKKDEQEEKKRLI